MVCNSCGEKPKNTAKDFTKAVVEINNPDKLVLFRKVVVPVSMGTEEDFPASVGKYYNVLLQYEANGDMYLYSSDGIPTKLSSDVSELQHELEQLGIKVDGEILARIAADSALEDSITALDDSLATVAKTGDYNDLTNKPTIGNATLTIKRNNANVGTFTANATTDKSVDISVPTKTSDITNDGSDGSSTYVENDELSAVATSGSYNDLLNKPTIGNATLTIKKNNTNVGTFTANATSNKSINITVPTKTSELTNNGSDNTSTYVEADELATVATTGNYNDLTNKPTIGNGTLTIKRNSTQLGTFKANATSGTTVDISVPTKTSDLTNDGADGTSTFVEADDLPVVDTTYSASSNNAIANSTVTNSLNRDVMTNLTLDTSPSTTTVNLNNTKTNLASPSSTTTTAITLPVASSTQAGVMNSSTFDAVTNNTNNINALLSGAVAVTGLPASPTQAQITSAWQSETGLSSLINRASVYDVTNNKVWTYYTNDTTWHAASNTSQVTVNTFTNSSEGVIKGSTNTGQVFAENDGTGSVNGWDTLTGTVANHTSKLATIEQGAEVNVQSNWTQTNTTADDYIKNKPANLVQDANYVHTDNNFTTTLKNKLNGIESGAEVNQNAFSNVSVNGVTVAADAKTDTLTLTAGNNVTLTGDASNDTVTISSTDTNTTYSFANGTNGFTVTPSGGSAQTITVTPSIDDATTSTSGLMSAADKTEFDLSNRVQRRLISDGTLIPDNSDLNTIPFLSVGRYVIQGTVHASTLVNCPTAKAFAMEVANSTDDVLDNESTGKWIYRVRRITTYDGDEYKQFVHSGNTAGVFTYGSWLKIATTSNIPTVNNATLTIQKNGTNVQTFTANSSEDKTANITVPTAVSELTNDANYATTTQLSDGLATKQNTLTAGNAIDITNDVISADVYPADFFTNATETTSDTGTDIALTNTAFAPLASVTPKGDTSQQTYTGKNLLKLEAPTASQAGGLTIIPDATTGTITFSGTNTGTYPWLNGLVNTTLPAGTYTFSINTALPYNLTVRFYNENSQFPTSAIITAGQTKATATTTYAIAKLGMVYSVSTTGVTIPSTTIYPQLESGSTATAFEPYVGGTASPNPDYPQDVKVVTGEQTVKVTGKNLLQNTLITAPVTKNGVTITPNTDGTFTLNGTCTASAWTNFANDKIYSDFGPNAGATGVQTLDGYTLSWAIDTGEIRITHATGTGNWGLQIRSGSVYNNATLKYQLEAGTTATGWQPYQSQEYEVNLFENLYDKNSAYKSGSDVLLEIAIQPNTTYIFNTGKAWTGAFLYDSNNTQTRKVGNDASLTHSVEFTTASNEVKARLTFYAGSTSIDNIDFSHIFFYVKNSIELCKIGDYQDYFYKDGGNWYKHAKINKVTFDGSVTPDSINTNSTNTTRVGWASSYAAIFKAAYTDTTGIYSNYFPQNSNWNVDRIGIAYSNSNGGVWFRANKTTIGTTSGEVVTWLTNHPVDLYFIKQTATQEQITDSGLIAQLEALANANSYRDTTDITTASDGANLPVIIAAEAFTNTLSGISKVINGKQDKQYHY